MRTFLHDRPPVFQWQAFVRFFKLSWFCFRRYKFQFLRNCYFQVIPVSGLVAYVYLPWEQISLYGTVTVEFSDNVLSRSSDDRLFFGILKTVELRLPYNVLDPSPTVQQKYVSSSAKLLCHVNTYHEFRLGNFLLQLVLPPNFQDSSHHPRESFTSEVHFLVI